MRLSERKLKGLVIGFLLKKRQTSYRSIERVVDDPTWGVAGTSWHGPK